MSGFGPLGLVSTAVAYFERPTGLDSELGLAHLHAPRRFRKKARKSDPPTTGRRNPGRTTKNKSTSKYRHKRMPYKRKYSKYKKRSTYSKKRKRSYGKKKRKTLRKKVMIPALNNLVSARSNHYIEGIFSTSMQMGRSNNSEGRFTNTSTIGGFCICVDRLKTPLLYGSNTTVNTYDIAPDIEPTNHKTMSSLFAKYYVTSMICTATFTNCRAKYVANVADVSGETASSHSEGHYGQPMYAGGYIDDQAVGNTATPVDLEGDPWLQPMHKMRIVQPGETVSFTWTVNPRTLHGNVSIADNELAAEVSTSRAANPTNLRLYAHPLTANTSSNPSEHTGVWHIKTWRKAVWTEKIGGHSNSSNDVP